MDKRKLTEELLQEVIKRFESRLEYLRTKSRRFSWYRLSLFFISLVLFFYFFFSGRNNLLYVTVILFVAAFGILTGIHNKIETGIRRNIIWRNIKKLHLSRMNLKWNELPPLVFTPDEKHPFEFDLNITGEYSLHRLVNTSSSYEGSRILKDWLTEYNTDTAIALKRQELIKELSQMHRFRDKLTLNSTLTSRKELKGTKISEWIESPVVTNEIKKVLVYSSVLIPLNIILFVLYLINAIPGYFLFGLLVYTAVYWLNSKYTKGLFEELLEVEDEFGKFTVIFDLLEQYPYIKGSKIEEYCSIFTSHSPSVDFKKIRHIANMVGLTRNPLVGLILNVIYPYNFFYAYRLETIKVKVKKDLPLWLQAWHNLEAYNSLANYAYLNPQCTFPGFHETGEIFSAKGLGHPLIHYKTNIVNNFSISKKGEVFIITGSNMSGKSTFLKTIGMNMVMANAGGVVYARNFRAAPLRVFCCIKISDSVTDGISYFYAEVKRLKNLLQELNDNNKIPVLFLIDEIFRGTNNIERLTGSRSYIKEAVKLNGTGLVSTHDLELSRLEEEITTVKNYHFREEASEGRMIFDYIIHPGPSPTTNALKIMKSEGLPVD
jgi:ABC-type multidrug transport system fused ATPase/permease subunit